jgi:hypothetical protein
MERQDAVAVLELASEAHAYGSPDEARRQAVSRPNTTGWLRNVLGADRFEQAFSEGRAVDAEQALGDLLARG